MMFDLIVIGGGPGGYHAALRAAGNGLRTALVEKSTVGGVCLNSGCVPSKTLLNSSKKLHNNSAFGIVGSDVGQLDMSSLQKRKSKIVSGLVKSIISSLKKNGVELIEGEASIHKNVDGLFTVSVGGTAIETQNIIIATGSSPATPKIDGIDQDFVVTSSELLDLDRIPSSLVVVGGGVIGLEMATFFAEAGAVVSVVEAESSVAANFDVDCIKILLSSLKKMGVKVYLNSVVQKFSDSVVTVERESGGINVECEKALVSIGRTPNSIDVNKELGAECDPRGAFVVDEFCKTSVEGVYAVGDVNGKLQLAHVAYREAEVAVDTILKKGVSINYDTIPSVIYSHPEIASVGFSLKVAHQRGLKAIEKKRPFGGNGRFLAETDRERGICKVVLDEENGEIYGIHLAGLYASELISTAAMIVQLKLNVSDIERLVFPHPAVSEIIKETILED